MANDGGSREQAVSPVRGDNIQHGGICDGAKKRVDRRGNSGEDSDDQVAFCMLVNMDLAIFV